MTERCPDPVHRPEDVVPTKRPTDPSAPPPRPRGLVRTGLAATPAARPQPAGSASLPGLLAPCHIEAQRRPASMGHARAETRDQRNSHRVRSVPGPGAVAIPTNLRVCGRDRQHGTLEHGLKVRIVAYWVHYRHKSGLDMTCLNRCDPPPGPGWSLAKTTRGHALIAA
jgi:hypothetical protein